MDRKFFVIEGLDGTGKTTQINLLKEKFPNYDYLKFPAYESETGYFITKYLNEELKINESNLSEMEKVKRISMLYAMDRCNFIKNIYDPKSNITICDRYLTSNIIHQTHNLTYNEIDEYIHWLYTIEYYGFEIPKPNKIIFLDLPYDVAYKNINNRGVHDVLEQDDVMKASYDRKDYIIEKCGLIRINCYDPITKKMRDIEDINSEIINILEL